MSDAASSPAVGVICWGKPPSANKPPSASGKAFLLNLQAAYRAEGGPRFTGLLYGRVYWFIAGYQPALHPDADNLSKKIWDALGLQGIAFADDAQVRLRTAAVVDVLPAEDGLAATELLISAMPGKVAEALDALLDGPPAAATGLGPGFAYVECGPLEAGMLWYAVAAAEGREPPT